MRVFDKICIHHIFAALLLVVMVIGVFFYNFPESRTDSRLVKYSGLVKEISCSRSSSSRKVLIKFRDESEFSYFTGFGDRSDICSEPEIESLIDRDVIAYLYDDSWPFEIIANGRTILSGEEGRYKAYVFLFAWTGAFPAILLFLIYGRHRKCCIGGDQKNTQHSKQINQ